MRNNGHEPGRETALGHERAVGIRGDSLHRSGTLQVLAEVQIVDTLPLGSQRYGRRNVIGRGIDDHVAALQRCRQTFRLRSVERQRGDADLREHPKTRFILVEDQNIVITGLEKKMSDGVADLSCADQRYTPLVAVLVGHDHATPWWSALQGMNTMPAATISSG